MAARTKHHRTEMVPVTTMEEVPVLDALERAELLESLERASAEVKAGAATEYDPKSFKDRLLRIYRDRKR
jgi:hypothetical protein